MDKKFDVKKLRFSGKRVDNGEVVEGYFMKEQGCDGKYLISSGAYKSDECYGAYLETWEVHPESVKCNIKVGLNEEKITNEILKFNENLLDREKITNIMAQFLAKALNQAPDLIEIMDGE